MKSSIPVSVERSLHNFESIACEWLSKYSPSWSQSHAKRMARLFERDLFPLLGNRPIADITPPQLLEVLRRIEARGALETPCTGVDIQPTALYAFDLARRCGAKTRVGALCKSPAVRSRSRCCMHGGANGSSAPKGNQNAFKHGYTTGMAIAQRVEIRDLTKICVDFMREIEN